MNIMLPSFQWNLEPGYLQGILAKDGHPFMTSTRGGAGSGGRGEGVQFHVDVCNEICSNELTDTTRTELDKNKGAI